jgi:hypothetical protein
MLSSFVSVARRVSSFVSVARRVPAQAPGAVLRDVPDLGELPQHVFRRRSTRFGWRTGSNRLGAAMTPARVADSFKVRSAACRPKYLRAAASTP